MVNEDFTIIESKELTETPSLFFHKNFEEMGFILKNAAPSAYQATLNKNRKSTLRTTHFIETTINYHELVDELLEDILNFEKELAAHLPAIPFIRKRQDLTDYITPEELLKIANADIPDFDRRKILDVWTKLFGRNLKQKILKGKREYFEESIGRQILEVIIKLEEAIDKNDHDHFCREPVNEQIGRFIDSFFQKPVLQQVEK